MALNRIKKHTTEERFIKLSRYCLLSGRSWFTASGDPAPGLRREAQG